MRFSSGKIKYTKTVYGFRNARERPTTTGLRTRSIQVKLDSFGQWRRIIYGFRSENGPGLKRVRDVQNVTTRIISRI